MREVDGFGVFEFGQIWQITMLRVNQPLNLPIVGNWIYLLKAFANHPNNQNDFKHSISIIHALINNLEKITQEKPFINNDEFGILNNLVWQLRTSLSNDFNRIFVTVLEERGGRSVDTLWKNPLNLLSEDVVSQLSDFVKENFSEAAKCLVLDRYTAVGFHAMRCVERVARKYYEIVTGKSPVIIHNQGKPNEKHIDMGLGQIANDLLSKYNSLEGTKPRPLPSGDLGLIAVTTQALCKNYRDKLSHPDIEKLDRHRATTTLNQTIETISSIVMDAKTGGTHFATHWTGDAF